MRNIFLDTSVFEKECFRVDENSKLTKLAKLKEQGKVRLFITDVVEQELIQRVKKSLEQEYPLFSKNRIIKSA